MKAMEIMDSSNIYTGFANVYDRFMEHIPYEEWFAYLHDCLVKGGVEQGEIVELACGTGEITKRLWNAGYQVIGTDLSEEMLMIAREKCGDGVFFLHQDMRKTELVGEVDAFVCVGDGMNYLDSIQEMEQVFGRVFLYLKKGGIFLFDLKTEYYFKEILGNRTITENREDASYIWENFYDENAMRNEYLLTVYDLVDDDRDLFIRSDEIHYQQVFSLEEVKMALEKMGFALEYAYEAFSEKEPSAQTERVYLCARKNV